MTIDSIFEKYKNQSWMEEEASISNHVMEYWADCYLQWKKVFKKEDLFSCCFFLIDNNYLKEWSSKEDAEKVLAWVVDKYQKDKRYWQLKDKDYKKINDKIDKLFYFFRDLDIYSLSKKELSDYLEELMSLGSDQFAYNIFAESVDIADENYYANVLPKMSADKLAHLVELLSTPEYLSFVEREYLALLKITKKYYKNENLKKAIGKNNLADIKKYKDFYKDIKNHQGEYFWMQNNYREAKILSLEYFLKELGDVLKKNSLADINKKIKSIENKAKILSDRRRQEHKKYKISKQADAFFAVVRFLAAWQDRRKENVQKILSAVDKILTRLSKEEKLSKKILREYFIKELKQLILKGQKISKSKLAQRKLVLFYCYFDKQGRIKKEIFYGQDVNRVKEYFKAQQMEGDDLKGFVASRGNNQTRVVGRVKIVLDANRAKFDKGDILVTGMTRPEFVPLMKKAKAIITNEGGITTHAAIVSRELKIPCIIGTKIATEVLRNGDRVEMDMSKGIIKKI